MTARLEYVMLYFHVLESAARIVLFCSTIVFSWRVAMDPLPVTNTIDRTFVLEIVTSM